MIHSKWWNAQKDSMQQYGNLSQPIPFAVLRKSNTSDDMTRPMNVEIKMRNEMDSQQLLIVLFVVDWWIVEICKNK